MYLTAREEGDVVIGVRIEGGELEDGGKNTFCREHGEVINGVDQGEEKKKTKKWKMSGDGGGLFLYYYYYHYYYYYY